MSVITTMGNYLTPFRGGAVAIPVYFLQQDGPDLIPSECYFKKMEEEDIGYKEVRRKIYRLHLIIN